MCDGHMCMLDQSDVMKLVLCEAYCIKLCLLSRYAIDTVTVTIDSRFQLKAGSYLRLVPTYYPGLN